MRKFLKETLQAVIDEQKQKEQLSRQQQSQLGFAPQYCPATSQQLTRPTQTATVTTRSVPPPLPARSPRPEHKQLFQSDPMLTPQISRNTAAQLSPASTSGHSAMYKPPDATARSIPRNARSPSAPLPSNLNPRPVPQAGDRPTIRKILCLDGGGIRGLSEILILKELMRRVSGARGFPNGQLMEPWQEFDMICGTSTGGLLAIMLGRLRMTLKQCQEAYIDLSAKIFTPVRSTNDYVGRARDFLNADGRFSAAPMEQTIKDLLRNRGLAEEELMWDETGDSQSCLV